MASSEYYDNTGYPGFGTPGSSAPMRGEFVKIENGFGKLPDLSGNGGEVVTIKTDETGMETVTTTGTGNFVRANDPTFLLSDLTTNNASTSQHGWMQKYPGGTSAFLRADGTFATPPSVSLVASLRSSNTILASADNSTLIKYTSGTFSQTLTAAATLGNGWFIYVWNAGTGVITFDPNGGELIDGVVTGELRHGMILLIQCTGTAFICTRVGPNNSVEVLTSGTSWTAPLGVTNPELEQVGGGGSGRRGSGANRDSPGGSAGWLRKVLTTTPGTAYTYAIGQGGAAQTVNGTDGNTGGNTTFTVGATTYTASGGQGGTVNGAAGGTATNGDINVRGGYSLVISGSATYLHAGGNPLAPTRITSGTTVNGEGFGGGGDGSAAGTNSGSGANGVVIIRY